MQQLKASPRTWDDTDVLDCALFRKVFKTGGGDKDVRAQTDKRKVIIKRLHDSPRDVSSPLIC